ncbi:uncharacterized protein LOC116261916 isoform X2 [Nymphaea colorata]|uniref:uncharacterized protein LOC116261916 isoform X2 n=1 Tax=Nymphaea colorata TaxID=210225 RepID=UPI00129D6F7A|nr:uncharacterized protein LOC116261916 isoform X2 [Nymphaea colorata]
MAFVNGGLKKAMWLYPKGLGFNPSERWGHSACYFDGVVYIYGGCCGGMHFSDVLALDLTTMVWSTLSTVGKQPGTRDSHGMALVGHRMIVLGGTNGSKKINDLHMLDLRTKEWSEPKFEGNPPSPRESHTTTVIGDDKLLIFGGSGEGDGNYLNDVHILDLKNMKWISPVVNGEVPAPRDSHTAVAVESKLIVYGGDCGDRYLGDVDVLDMDSLTWSKLMIHGPSPGPRAGHATVTIDSKIYIIGGVGDRQYYSDVWVLDLSCRTWTQLDIGGQQPQGRFSHSAVVANSDVAIYGGCGEDERPLDDLLILQLGAEHPNGRYNISMCKIFGKQWSHDKPRASPCRNGFKHENSEKEAVSPQKPMLFGVHTRKHELNGRASEVDAESKYSPLQSSENLPVKRRTSQPRLFENGMEQEEHSHSLSQQSSPSQSDQEQAAGNPDMNSPSANLFKHRKLSHNKSNNLAHHQVQMRSSLQRSTQNGHFVAAGLHGHPKPEPFLYVSQNGRPDGQQALSDLIPPQKIAATKVLAIPNLIGAEVQGTVDGAFDSGYLMTANVNGQIFRGILFTPGPGFVAREASAIASPVILAQPTFVSIPHGAIPIPNASNGSRPVQLEVARQPINFVLPASHSNLLESREESNGSRAVHEEGNGSRALPNHGRDAKLRPLLSGEKLANVDENQKIQVPYVARPARVQEPNPAVQVSRAPSSVSPPQNGRTADLQGIVLSLGAPGGK